MAFEGPWRVANSLNKLLDQINDVAPNRSKVSDGSIADDAHSTSSDHYPRVISGYGSTALVRARDFTHDPGDGADMNEIAERLRRSRDPRISYVIWNRRIFSKSLSPWTWRTYTGDNPHDKHMHVSVGSDMDSIRAWQIGDAFLMALTDAQQLAMYNAVVGTKTYSDGSTRDLETAAAEAASGVLHGKTIGGGSIYLAQQFTQLRALVESVLASVADDADTAQIVAAVDALKVEINEVSDETVTKLGASDLTAAEKAEFLRVVLGDDAVVVGELLAQA